MSSSGSSVDAVISRAEELAAASPGFATCFTYIRDKLLDNRTERKVLRGRLREMMRHVQHQFLEGERPIAVWSKEDVEITRRLLQSLCKQRDFMIQNLEERVRLANNDIDRMQYIIQKRQAGLAEAQAQANLVKKYMTQWGGAMLRTHAEMQQKLLNSERAIEQGTEILQNRLDEFVQ